MPFLRDATKHARQSLCLRSKCGAIIVSNGTVIGAGYNAPPLGDITARRCTEEDYEHTKKPRSDKTCCIHAEWRAIMRALAHHPRCVKNATLYFMRIDDAGRPVRSGEPYCTVCSRLALDVGIASFVLWRSEGICVYDTHEYNERSYAFHKKPLT